MGSKRSLLEQGLGSILLAQLKGRARFVDAFCGTGAVGHYVAENTDTPVYATDLQSFAVELSAAVIARTQICDGDREWRNWQSRATRMAERSDLYRAAERFEENDWLRAPVATVKLARAACAKSETTIVRSYGGHYFSPAQAVSLDALRATVPGDEELKHLAIASVVSAASHCAASPGHTAQPFQPTQGGRKHLYAAWKRDPMVVAERTFKMLAARHARTRGRAERRDAADVVATLEPTDLVFIDPPYSAVHYSRFYHVLETVASGRCGPVVGVGRYPPPSERPVSDYSIKTKSLAALGTLLQGIADRGASVVMTFPAEEATNGLSGSAVQKLATALFNVSTVTMNGRFSTLGGNGKCDHRPARVPAYELVLTLHPK